MTDINPPELRDVQVHGTCEVCLQAKFSERGFEAFIQRYDEHLRTDCKVVLVVLKHMQAERANFADIDESTYVNACKQQIIRFADYVIGQQIDQIPKYIAQKNAADPTHRLAAALEGIEKALLEQKPPIVNVSLPPPQPREITVKRDGAYHNLITSATINPVSDGGKA